VDAGNHAASGRVHDRGCTFEVQHCQNDGNIRSEQGGNEAEDCSPHKHVRCHVRQYVDQQRRRACVVLFHHPGMSAICEFVKLKLTNQPILRNLPADSNMTKALLLGIALASNIGGAASPIASPQNLIALQNMNPEPSWGLWFFIALPVCIISILLIWGLLVLTFQPGKGTTIVPIRPMKDKFTGVQWFISIVTVVTIILWCVSHQLEDIFGDMGVVAIIPLVLFFGTGILTKEDFNNFLWTIIILAAGGLALGKSVNSSGLLHTIAESITSSVEGMSLYGVLVVFCGLILVIATFISHTVAALIVLPLVQQVGQSMPEPHPNLLVMGAVLMASGAMGLPTSGFPNMSKSFPVVLVLILF